MAIFKDFNPVDHDRAIEDRRRHKELVEKSIKENLGDILSEESIIGEGKDRKFKIPIRGLKEYQFIYGKNNSGTTTGEGDEKRGQKIGSDKESGAGKGSSMAGSEEGEDIYETEVTIDDIMNYLIEDLELPNLDKKRYSEILTQSSKRKRGYQKYGIRPRLSKKRTVMEKIKRKQGHKRAGLIGLTLGENKRFPFKQEDLRYFKVKKTLKRESNAVIICIMDTSGSMDTTKKYLARSFFFVLSRFIRRKYSNVKVEFIAHTTTAKVVSQEEFFHKGESGGTYISSGYNKAIELINEKYNPSLWNVYSFYVSDGDNWSEDNEKAISKGRELCKLCNMLGYAELMPAYYSNTIKERFLTEIDLPNFTAVTVKKKSELWLALKAMLKKDIKEV